MGIIGFQSPALSLLLAPIQSFVAWFVPSSATPRQFPVPAGAPRVPSQLALPFTSSRESKALSASQDCIQVTTATGRPAKRVKIVRELDASRNPAFAGRMVISGRMAEVCAELDRLAVREGASG